MGIKKQGHSDVTIRGAAQQIKKGTINLNHRIQRRGAWTELQKQLFIASMLENIKIPGIIAVEENGIKYALDGKQRITAGIEYFDNQFPLCGIEYLEDIELDELESDDPIEIKDIAGKLYKDLPQAAKNKLHTFNYKIDVYKDLNDRQIKKLFKRYNGGTPLNKAQLLHCDSDFMNDYVNELFSNYFFKDVVNVTTKMRDKFADENVIKQCLLLLHSKEDSGIEDIDLKFFVAEMEDIRDTSDYANLLDKMKSITEYLSIAFTAPVKELRRTHIPVIIITAQEAIKKDIKAENFGVWAKEFLINNTGRKANSEYKNLSGSGASKKANITRRIELALLDFNANVGSVIIEESEPEIIEEVEPKVIEEIEPVEAVKNEIMVIETEQQELQEMTA